jgi:hypothetical protein
MTHHLDVTPAGRAPLRAMIIVAAATAAACIGRAQQADARSEIEDAYRRADAAYVSAKTVADLEAIREWLDTPDCVYADFGQPPRRWPEMRAYAVEGLQTPIEALHSSLENLDVVADRAVATAIVKGVAHIVDAEGRFGAKGLTHDIETTATVRDEWVRTTDRWRRKSHTKIVANHVTAIDGRAVARSRL